MQSQNPPFYHFPREKIASGENEDNKSYILGLILKIEFPSTTAPQVCTFLILCKLFLSFCLRIFPSCHSPDVQWPMIRLNR